MVLQIGAALTPWQKRWHSLMNKLEPNTALGINTSDRTESHLIYWATTKITWIKTRTPMCVDEVCKPVLSSWTGVWSYWIDKRFWSCGSHEEPALIDQKWNHSFLYCFKLFNIISFQMFPRTISKHTGNFIGISKHTEFLPLQNRNTSYVTSSQGEWWRNSNDIDTWHLHGPQRSCEGTGRASKHRRSPVSPFPSLMAASFTM